MPKPAWMPLLCVVPDPRSLSLPLDCDNTRTGPWMSTSGSGPSCPCWQEQMAPVPLGTPPSRGQGRGCLQQHSKAGLTQPPPCGHRGAPSPAQPCLRAADVTWLGAEATEWRRSSSRLDGCPGAVPVPVPVPSLSLSRVCACTASVALWHRLDGTSWPWGPQVTSRPLQEHRGAAGGSQAHTLLLEVVGRGQASRGSRLSRVP